MSTPRPMPDGYLSAAHALPADALIASTYLAGTNTRRRASRAGGVVRRDSRQGHGEPTWRKVKSAMGCLEHPLTWPRNPIVRLILDGTVVRVRLDRKGDSISTARCPRRARGRQKVAAARSRAWAERAPRRGALSSTILIRRGLRRPELLIVDGAPGLDKAIASVWDGVPVQRCTVQQAQEPFRGMPPSACMTRSPRITNDMDLRNDTRGR